MWKNYLIVVMRYLPTSVVLRDSKMVQLDFLDHPGSVRSDERIFSLYSPGSWLRHWLEEKTPTAELSAAGCRSGTGGLQSGAAWSQISELNGPFVIWGRKKHTGDRYETEGKSKYLSRLIPVNIFSPKHPFLLCRETNRTGVKWSWTDYRNRF